MTASFLQSPLSCVLRVKGPDPFLPAFSPTRLPGQKATKLGPYQNERQVGTLSHAFPDQLLARSLQQAQAEGRGFSFSLPIAGWASDLRTEWGVRREDDNTLLFKTVQQCACLKCLMNKEALFRRPGCDFQTKENCWSRKTPHGWRRRETVLRQRSFAAEDGYASVCRGLIRTNKRTIRLCVSRPLSR